MIKIFGPWMKVKVNIISTWRITMSEAVYHAMFDYDHFNGFWGIAREGHTHTDRQTETHTDSGSSILNFFENKKPNEGLVKDCSESVKCTALYSQHSLAQVTWSGCIPQVYVSGHGLVVRRSADKRKDALFNTPLLLAPFSSKKLIYGHCLVTLPCTINETLNGSHRCPS